MFVCLFLINNENKQSGQGQVRSPMTGAWKLLHGHPKWSHHKRVCEGHWWWQRPGQEETKHWGQSGIESSRVLKPQFWLNALDQTPGNYQTVMGTDIYISPKLVREIVLFSRTQSWRQHFNNSQHADHPWSSPSCYRDASPDWDYQWAYAWPHADPAANQRPSHKWPLSPEDI